MASSTTWPCHSPSSVFLNLLWLFCNRTTVSDAARILSKNVKTVRTIYKAIRQCMAEDLLDENGNTEKIVLMIRHVLRRTDYLIRFMMY